MNRVADGRIIAGLRDRGKPNGDPIKVSLTQLGTFPLRIGLFLSFFAPVGFFCSYLSMGYIFESVCRAMFFVRGVDTDPVLRCHSP